MPINAARTAILSLGFTVTLVNLPSTFADEPDTASNKAKAPALEPVFSDDFSEDTRGDYDIKGDVSWEAGKLTLPEGASLAREIDGGAWTKVKLRLEPVQLATQQGESELRIWFRLDGATDCFVRLRQKLKDGQAISSIALVDTGEKDGQPFEKLVRELALAGIEMHDIGVDYRLGRMQVTIAGEQAFAGYISNKLATVRTIAVTCSRSGLVVKSLFASTYRPEQRNYTASDRQQLTKAAAENKELSRLYLAGKFAGAAKVGERILAARRSVLGEQHPDYATSLNSLAVMYNSMGDYARAEPLSRQAMEVRKSVLGEQHPNYAISLNNLAALYENMGDYARAEPLYKQAREILKSVLGEQHSSYAGSLNNLAGLYESMGDYARAEPLYRQAMEIRKSVLGEQHPHYAESLNNLAVLNESMGDYARAEPLYRQALEINKSVLGEQHPHYASSLNNLAVLYKSMGDYARAESLTRQAMKIRKLALGEQHPDYAESLKNLATLYMGMGDYARAEPLSSQAMEIRKSALGEQHPDYASSLNGLAQLYESMGDYARAVPLFRQAMDVQRGQLNTNATVQSARQQNRNQNKLRFYLDGRLATAVALSASNASSVAADLWAWKGAVTAQQQAYRKVAANPILAPLFAKLQSVTRQLSAATGAIPTPPAKSASETKQNAFRTKRELWEKRVTKLTREREDLEQQIAAGSLEFRRITEPFTAGKLQALLPTGTALIDFLEYRHGTPDHERKGKMNYERRYLAVVVSRNGPVRLVGLGSAEVISDGIASFRRRLQPTLVSAEERQTAAEAGLMLRKSLWLPIEEHLDGIHTVIISPDTALGTLPFAVLPGKKPSSYLLEDYRIAMLPMANQMLSLFEDERPALNGRGLLVVGDVDYSHQFDQQQSDLRERLLLADSSSQWEADQLRSGNTLQFASLPGFRKELDLVETLFQSQFPDLPSNALSGGEATEEGLLKQSANARILHLITHGYFSDPKVKSISQAEVRHDELISDNKGPDPFINTYLPGLLSGLAMAGANNPSTDPEDPRDGILRASEIEASSLQGVDLIVLSACETGLGKVAGGEGLTGLQRAFHVAGARSVIASLWKVDDAATTELMRLFYTNLWEKKMSKIDALREAQLTMLNRFDIKTGKVRGLGGNEGQVDPDKTVPSFGKSLRADPRYWAAFQLSGDWR